MQPVSRSQGDSQSTFARWGNRRRVSRKSWTAIGVSTAILMALAVGAVRAAPAHADETAYLVNVTVRPGYNFPSAQTALAYGYGLCDRMRAGQGYPQLMSVVKSDFSTGDEYQASYLISQSAQELCPAMIWQLRQSAAVGPTP